MNNENVDKYKSELSDIAMALGEVDIYMGDYESAVANFLECLKYREAIYPENSRKIADTLYYVGISQFSLGQSTALSSEDDASLVEVAKKTIKDAYETFIKTQKTLCHSCLDLALKEKLIEKKGKWDYGR